MKDLEEVKRKDSFILPALWASCSHLDAGDDRGFCGLRE